MTAVRVADAVKGSAMLRDAIFRARGIEPPRHDPIPVRRRRDYIWVAPSAGPRSPIADIQNTVASYYKLPPVAMKSKRRLHAHPRQVAMYLASELTTFSLVVIGREFGQRDHTTALHAIRAVAKRISNDPEIAADVAALREALAG